MAEAFSGYAFAAEEMQGTAIPILKIGNIQNHQILNETDSFYDGQISEKLEKYVLQKDDFVIAMTGAGSVGRPGKMMDYTYPFLVNQRVAIVRANSKKVNPTFLFYFYSMEYVERYLYGLGIGAGQPNISADDILSLKVTFPPLPTQQKIASILSAYDNLIQNYKKQIEALQTTASELYKEWFVRFRFPGYQTTKFENGIPEGWKVVRLKDIAKDVGKAITKTEIDFEKDVYIPIDCIPNHNMALTEISNIENAESSLQHFESGDILFGAMRVYFHKVILAPIQGVTRKTCFVIHAKKDILHNYLYSLLFSDTTINYANTISVGATMPYVRWNDFIRMQCLLPSEKILNDYNKIISSIFKRIMNSYEYLTNLTKQRDLLLPRLMSGKLEVN